MSVGLAVATVLRSVRRLLASQAVWLVRGKRISAASPRVCWEA